MNKFDGWVNLFWIQFKQYFSSVTSWLTLIFVPIIFSFGLGAAIGVATGFIPALCMILIVLQANVFSSCYFSFKKSTLNSNVDLTAFTKTMEYTSTICLVFFTSLIGMFFAIGVYAIDTQLLPMLGINQFLSTAPAFEPNPIINAPLVVAGYLQWGTELPFDEETFLSMIFSPITAPKVGQSWELANGNIIEITDGRYITNWLFFEWNVLFYFFFEVTISTVTISLLFTAFSNEVKVYFLFMFGYLVAFMVFGGVMGPEYNYANPDGSFSRYGAFAGMPPKYPPVEGASVSHGWMFYVERINPLFYINQWAFTIMGTATVYQFDVSYNEQTYTFYQSMTPWLRMSYDSSITAYVNGVPNPDYYLGMTSPRLNIENAIPETNRWVLSATDPLYNMLQYMPWVWSGFYIISTSVIDYWRRKKA